MELRADGRPRKTPLDHLVLLFLYSTQIYYGYRYALQYNSTETSPTYADTPMVFQAGKYVLFALWLGLAGLTLLFQRRTASPRRTYAPFFLLVFAALFVHAGAMALGRYLTLYEVDRTYLLTFCFLPYLPFFCLSNLARHPRAMLGRFLELSVLYHAAYSVLAIGLYLAVGRLPALAYAGGLVRFGGGWDDPNGFGLFSGLIILLLLANPFRAMRPWKRLAGLAIMVPLHLLTFSASAIGGALIGGLVFLLLASRPAFLAGLGLLGALAGTVYLRWRDQIDLLIAYKRGSFADHLEAASQLAFLAPGQDRGLSDLLFGVLRENALNENFFLTMLNSYGVVGLGLLLIVLATTLYLALARRRACLARGDRPAARYHEFLFSGLCLAIVAANGIPYFTVYPVNIYLLTLMALVWTAPRPARPAVALPSLRLQEAA